MARVGGLDDLRNRLAVHAAEQLGNAMAPAAVGLSGTHAPGRGQGLRELVCRTRVHHRDVTHRLHSVVRALDCSLADAEKGVRCDALVM
jgi:hypothetical protein